MRNILTVLLLTICAINVFADDENVLVGIDTRMVAGTNSGNLQIELKNSMAVSGLQFDIQLPQGITIAQENNKYAVQLTERKEDHAISTSLHSNNVYRVTVLSPNGEDINGNDGVLVKMTLCVDKSVEGGEYGVDINNIVLSTGSDYTEYPQDTSLKLTIIRADIGDVNGDGRINISDAQAVVNHILKRPSQTFLDYPADANQDGKIDISDAFAIVLIIHGQYEPPVNEDVTLELQTDENGRKMIKAPVLAYQPVLFKVDDGGTEHFEYYPNAKYGEIEEADDDMMDFSDIYVVEAVRENGKESVSRITKSKDIKYYTFANSEIWGNADYHINSDKVSDMNVHLIDYSKWSNDTIENSFIQEPNGEVVQPPSQRYVSKISTLDGSVIHSGLMHLKVGFKDFAAYESYFEKMMMNSVDLQSAESLWGFTGKPIKTLVDYAAVQLTKGDNVVATSDFAAVWPVLYHVRHITDICPTRTWKSSEPVSEAKFAINMPTCEMTTQMQRDFPDMHTLFYDANSAIEDAPTHFVGYSDTINLRPYLRTHFSYRELGYPVNSNMLHQYESLIDNEDALLSMMGLHYEYYLVNYSDSQSGVQESLFLEHLDSNGNGVASSDNLNPDPASPYFAVRSVGSDGMTLFGKKATRSAVDHEPLIRVELRTDGGDIIEAGYMKVIISEKVDQISREPIPVVKDFVGPYDMNCSNADSMTWYEFENIVLAAKKDDGSYYLNLNKIEFDKFYQPDFVDAKDGIFARYIKNANGTFSPETVDKRGLMGDVTWKEDLKNKETSVVKFDFGDPENAIKLLGVKENADGTLMLNEKPYETWIRFVDINGVYGDVYLKLSIGEEKLQYVIAQVKNKILSDWYNFNGTDKDQAQEAAIPTNIFEDFDVHMNVYTPNVINRPLTIIDDFEKDLYEYFYNPKYDEQNITPEGVAHDILDWKLSNADKRFENVSKHGEFVLVNPFDNGTDKNTNHFASKWEVKGYSGDLYTLRVDEPAKTDDGGYVQNIWAKKGTVVEKIVSLTYTPDKDEKDLVNDEKANLKLLKSEYGYDIMNYVGHSSVTDDNLVFTAYLKVESPEACYSFVKRPYFNVRFLRPINWYPKGEYTINDAPNKTQEIPLNTLINFNDWRTSDNTNESPYSNYTGNSYVVADQADLFTAGTTPEKEITSYKYYGIKLTSNDKECLTDIHRGEDARTLLTADQVKEALRNIENNVMSENRVRYTGTCSGLDLKYNPTTNAYTYQNNKGNVQYFHIYVPLYIQYTFSPWATDHLFIKTWSAITVNKTVSNAKQN